MVMSKNLPAGFLSWLMATYTPEQVSYWIATNLDDFGNDPVFRYWQEFVRPPPPTSEELLARQRGDEEKLTAIIQALLDNTDMTQKEAEQLFERSTRSANPLFALQSDPLYIEKGRQLGDLWPAIRAEVFRQLESPAERAQITLNRLNLPQETRIYLGEFTSEKDLADRIARLNLDQNTSEAILEAMLAKETKQSLATRAAQERVSIEQRKAQEARGGRATQLTQALDSIQNDPFVSQKDLALHRQNLETFKAHTGRDITEEFLSGQSDSLMRLLENIKREAIARRGGEEQLVQAQQATSDRRAAEAAAERQRRDFERQQELVPPSAGPIVQQFLEGQPQPAAGTRLRSFIEAQIPGILEETRKVREEWWRRMHPEIEREEEERELESEIGSLEREAERRAVAATDVKRLAPFGRAAEFAIEARRKFIEGQLGMPELERTLSGLRSRPRPEPEEDPLLKKLRSADFSARFFRQPRTGIVSRLQPSIRFR